MAAAAAAAEAIAIGEEQELEISAPTKAGLALEEDFLFNPQFRKWDQEECDVLPGFILHPFLAYQSFVRPICSDATLIQEADKEKKISKGFLRPDGQTRAAWEAIMMCFTIYCAFSIPVQMAWAARPSDWLVIFEVKL